MNIVHSTMTQCKSVLIAMVVLAFLCNSVFADEQQSTNTAAQQQVSEDSPSSLCGCFESCVTESSWCSKICSSASGEGEEGGESQECYSNCERKVTNCELDCLYLFPPCGLTRN